MFKKIKKIISTIDKIDLVFDELKLLFYDFEKKHEDGKITPQEALDFIFLLLNKLRKIFPKL